MIPLPKTDVIKLLTVQLFTVLSLCILPAFGQQNIDLEPDLENLVDSLVETGELSESDITEKSADQTKVFVFEIKEDIMPPAWRTVKQAMNEASEKEADYIFLKLNTYGGMVNIADSISSKMINAEVPTMVYIMQNAASAGALISISCDSIYMAPTARIGAATVVTGTGEAAPDKYQSYMRSTMRSVAAANGRDETIAEAMVDESIEIPGISEEGQILTFTTSEAIEHGFCEKEADGFDEALRLAGFENAEIIEYNLTAVDNIVRFLTSPVVSGILMMIIFFGIYSELQTPGVGFALLAAAIAAILYFAPHYLDGLAENWEIMLFLLGVILLAVELFILPGFGVAGVLGLILMIGSMVLSMVGNVGFDFTYAPPEDMGIALVVVVSALLMSLVLITIFLRNVRTGGAFSKLVLETTQEAESGYTIDAFDNKNELVGAEGIAASDLRPSGKVDIADERYDASTEGGFIAKGDPIVVREVKSNYLLVRPNTNAS